MNEVHVDEHDFRVEVRLDRPTRGFLDPCKYGVTLRLADGTDVDHWYASTRLGARWWARSAARRWVQRQGGGDTWRYRLTLTRTRG